MYPETLLINVFSIIMYSPIFPEAEQQTETKVIMLSRETEEDSSRAEFTGIWAHFLIHIKMEHL